MIRPQLQAWIEQNVPKMPIARPFFVVFASRVLIYASILTKLGQNVDIHEVNNDDLAMGILVHFTQSRPVIVVLIMKGY